MAEEKETGDKAPEVKEETPPPEKTPEVKEEVPEQSTELIDKANEAAERMERANKQRESLLVREEALQVSKTLGGKAEAGENKEVTEDDKIIKGAKKYLKGTGYEDMFDEPKSA